MPTLYKSQVKFPDASLMHIKEIDGLGLSYTYDPQFDISLLDLKHRRVQVRDSDNYAPKDNVKQYAQAMAAGSEFPAIIVTSDLWAVDCNTRVSACRSLGINIFPALVLNEQFETGSVETRAKIKILAATVNHKNGQRLTTAEARAHVGVCLNFGMKVQEIEKRLGVNPNIINMIIRERAALARMSKVGMIPPSKEHLSNAGSPTLMQLNDEPYRQIVQLMVDTGFSAREVKALATQVKEDGSDQLGLARLAKVRAENKERILRHSLTGNGKPSKSAQFRQALGRGLSFEGQEREVVEKNPDLQEDHLDMMRRMRAMLDLPISLQEEEIRATHGKILSIVSLVSKEDDSDECE
jgi:hypothetical protein